METTISSGPYETAVCWKGLLICNRPFGMISIFDPLGANYYPLASMPMLAQLQSEFEFAVLGTIPATFELSFFTI
jgi:hypothetical protein